MYRTMSNTARKQLPIPSVNRLLQLFLPVKIRERGRLDEFKTQY